MDYVQNSEIFCFKNKEIVNYFEICLFIQRKNEQTLKNVL